MPWAAQHTKRMFVLRGPCSSKGSTWTSAVVIPSSAEGGPALAGYSTKLYAAWDGPPTGSGSFTIDYAAGP
jgi:hypothetical protein